MSDPSFTQFSLSLYQHPVVQSTCLRLQDDHDLDVIMILFCCWCGRHGARLDTGALVRTDTAIKPWREEIITPLRRIRKRMKTDVAGITPSVSNGLRERLKEEEIQAELLQLSHLETLAGHIPATDGRLADRGGIIRGNLIRYAKMNESSPPPWLLEDLVQATL